MTIKDIAKMANVSIGTVSAVINENTKGVSDAKREEILKIIEETGYVPSSVARGMVTKKTNTVGFIIPDISNPFFPLLVKGAEDKAAELGYNLFLCNTNGHSEQELNQVALMRKHRVDGIIISTSWGNDTEHVEKLMPKDLPVVFVDEPILAEEYLGVSIDNEMGGYIATQHLISLGHKSIAYITGPKNTTSAFQRLSGYKRALKEADLPFDEKLVRFGPYEEQFGYQKTKEFMNRGYEFTAIAAGSDFVASGIYRAARECGLSIPEDLSVIGFDDVFKDGFSPAVLSSVSQPVYEMGAKSMEILSQDIASRAEKKAAAFKSNILVYEPQLVLRSSTAAPKRPE